jgi:hypothetical protein
VGAPTCPKSEGAHWSISSKRAIRAMDCVVAGAQCDSRIRAALTRRGMDSLFPVWRFEAQPALTLWRHLPGRGWTLLDRIHASRPATCFEASKKKPPQCGSLRPFDPPHPRPASREGHRFGLSTPGCLGFAQAGRGQRAEFGECHIDDPSKPNIGDGVKRSAYESNPDR